MKRILNFFKNNKLVTVFIIIVLVGFVYYAILHSFPRTNNAFLTANVIPISAYVPGPITNIYVKNNEYVKAGTKLLTIYQDPFKLKVEQLKDKLNSLNYQLEAMKSIMKQDVLNVNVKKSAYLNSIYLSNQASSLAKENAVSFKSSEILERDMEETQYQYLIAKYQVNTDELNIKKTESEIKSTTQDLGLAQIDLEESTIYAPSNGYVSNMFTSIGRYAEVGEPLFSFVDSDSWLVQGNFKETELGFVKIGDKAHVTLWMYPWKDFTGKVVSIGNVNRQITSSINSLQEIGKENQWFLLPERLPVMIELDKVDSRYHLYVGATALVRIDVSSTIWLQMLFEPLFW